MTRAARILRLDSGTWYWLESESSPLGAGAVALGAYLALAFDRFGWPGSTVRPYAQLVLIGFFGWVWLAVSFWLIVRLTSTGRGTITSYLRVTGHAHFPLLMIAVFIQLVSMTMDVADVARWPAMFVAAFWMPAMLATAVAASSGLSVRRSAIAVALPYLLWAAVLGRHLWNQLGHLL